MKAHFGLLMSECESSECLSCIEMRKYPAVQGSQILPRGINLATHCLRNWGLSVT
jgi:hypothetical protein